MGTTLGSTSSLSPSPVPPSPVPIPGGRGGEGLTFATSSRRQSTAGITVSPDSSVSPFTGKTVHPAPEPVLVTPAGAGLGGGR
jgi:hypothetical protein